MGKAWDIIPPRPSPRKSSSVSHKKTSKRSSFFFVLLILILIGAFLYVAGKETLINVDGIATSSPQSPSKTEPVTSPTLKTKSNLLIKILNGSGHSEETDNVQALLKESGFKISKIENALNLYDQTIVYYQADQEQSAKDIAEVLKKYQAKTQKFSQETAYDIIVVIGAR